MKLPSDLSVTALYTSGVWSWGKLPDAELLDSADSRRVFKATKFVLGAARPFARRRASLEISLLHRHAAIDTLVRASAVMRVLELAAGLSRRGHTFSRQRDFEYIEVDRPAVVAYKRRLLARTAAGRSALARPNLHMIAADVTQTPLESLCPPDGKPLLVIAEGLMMYLDAEAQKTLGRSVATRLGRGGGGTFILDLVPPNELPPSGWVGAGLGWLMKKFTSGQTFSQDARSRDEGVRDLMACGFDKAQWIEPRLTPEALRLPYPEAPSQQLLFTASIANHTVCPSNGTCSSTIGGTCSNSAADGASCNATKGPNGMPPVRCVEGKCTLPVHDSCR
jgi:O-methyltransferase involved in polyketide biosynthesis